MQTKSPVLITGGSGLVGSAITRALLAADVPVRWLSTRAAHAPTGVQVFRWDPSQDQLDPDALKGVDTIIHLAGAGIADARWTDARKREIIGSRLAAAGTLRHALGRHSHQVKTIVAASATGFYGDRGETWVDEQSAAGQGFLSDTCVEWERALAELAVSNIRLVVLRIGFVLSRAGGALPAMRRPVAWMVGSPLGHGNQYISWIDLDDLVGIFRFAMDEPALLGTYNAVAPSPVTNRAFIQSMARVMRRPVWPFAVPGSVLRLLLGEQASVITSGQRVAAGKILQAGYRFKFLQLDDSLRHHLA